MLNRGKPIAGIKRVVELAALRAGDFADVVARGEDCFAAVANRDRQPLRTEAPDAQPT